MLKPEPKDTYTLDGKVYVYGEKLAVKVKAETGFDY